MTMVSNFHPRIATLALVLLLLASGAVLVLGQRAPKTKELQGAPIGGFDPIVITPPPPPPPGPEADQLLRVQTAKGARMDEPWYPTTNGVLAIWVAKDPPSGGKTFVVQAFDEAGELREDWIVGQKVIIPLKASHRLGHKRIQFNCPNGTRVILRAREAGYPTPPFDPDSYVKVLFEE